MTAPLPLYLQFDITHLCNKNCLLCDHRIRHSDYEYLTKEQYRYLVSCMDTNAFKAIQFIGGEPLCHPHFEWLVDKVTEDFGDRLLQIITNGLLLPHLSDRIRERLRILISPYPGFNDDIVAEFEHYDNVFIRKEKVFWNPYRDPNLPDDVAKQVEAICRQPGEVRIVGTKLYNCCMAEPAERYYHTDPVHVEFTKDWKKDWRSLPTWKACRHCFSAMRFTEQIKGIPCNRDLTWHRKDGLCIGERILESA